MKTKILLLLCLFGIMLSSCTKKSVNDFLGDPEGTRIRREQELNNILAGQHLLRKIYSEKKTERTASGGFFIFAGIYNSSEKTETTVTFSWQTNNDDYAYFTVPLRAVRLRIDNTIKQPMVVYHWAPNEHYDLRPDDIERATSFCEYVTFIVRDKDWPIDIEMPE